MNLSTGEQENFTNVTTSTTTTQLAFAALTLAALTAPFLLLNGLGPLRPPQTGFNNRFGSKNGHQTRGSGRSDDQWTEESMALIARVPQIIDMAYQLFEDRKKTSQSEAEKLII